MSERFQLQKHMTWQIIDQKECSGMSWAHAKYKKWTTSFTVQEEMHYEAIRLYLLKKIIEEDIAAGYRRQGNNPRDLPQLPQFVGGDTDFMLGMKYVSYYPEKVLQLPSGFTI